MLRNLVVALVRCAGKTGIKNAHAVSDDLLARRIRARIVPTLKFAIDDSVMRGAAMDSLISKAIEKDNKRDDMDDDSANDDSDNKSD